MKQQLKAETDLHCEQGIMDGAGSTYLFVKLFFEFISLFKLLPDVYIHFVK